MYKAAILETVNESAAELFEASGGEVAIFDKSYSVDQLTGLAKTHDVLGIRSEPKVPAEVFEHHVALRAIGCYCKGTDQVDLEAATRFGVAVFNSLHENTRSVAEHTMTLVGILLKGMHMQDRLMTEGKWGKTSKGVYELRGKTIGIVGYGAIGSQVSNLAEDSSMEVQYFDPNPKAPPYGSAQQLPDLKQLLGSSDIVTLHIPGSEQTKNMINQDTIAQIKPGAHLINTSRGDVVDIEAVLDALDSGRLGGFGIDVYPAEPKNYGDPFTLERLARHPKVFKTSHTAGAAIEAQKKTGQRTTEKLLGFLTTGNTVGSVNFPEIALNTVPNGITRILHVHENVPGVMADITALLAKVGINQASTKLETKQLIGYAAVDIEGDVTEQLTDDLQEVPGTIRVNYLQTDQGR